MTAASRHFNATREEIASFVAPVGEECWTCEANDLSGFALKFHPTKPIRSFLFLMEYIPASKPEDLRCTVQQGLQSEISFDAGDTHL